jgi:mono/diheme cytochrome c family protein
MGKFFKRVGLGFVGILILVVLVTFTISTVRINRSYKNYDIQVESLPIPTDQESIARGEHLATIYFCDNCHGDNLAGDYLLNDPVLAVIPAPNLTRGAGGVGATNTDEDWVRAIRHGVGHDMRGLVGMPARTFYHMSDQDLADLIAYLKTLPAVDNDLPERRFGPMFRVLLPLGQAPPSEASVIDHTAARPATPPVGATVSYGEYLSQICASCHGETLNGGTVRDFDGELITALNLTPGGELAAWSQQDFMDTLRTGITPFGRELTDAMPWGNFGQMTDEELQAIWLYLQSLPAMEQGFERTDQ